MTNIQILLSDTRGVYIPRDFIANFDHKLWGITDEEAERCKDPDSEGYWDAWTAITDKAKHIDKNGIEWSLYQDGDLFAVSWDNMTEEEKEEFAP